MVLKKRNYGGFHDFLAPVVPKAPRSLRVSVKLTFASSTFLTGNVNFTDTLLFVSFRGGVCMENHQNVMQFAHLSCWPR